MLLLLLLLLLLPLLPVLLFAATPESISSLRHHVPWAFSARWPPQLWGAGEHEPRHHHAAGPPSNSLAGHPDTLTRWPLGRVQMNTDAVHALPLLDNSLFLPLDETMTLSLDPSGPLPQSFATGPSHSPSRAFSPDDSTGNIPDTTLNPPRDPAGTGAGGASNPGTLTDFTKRRNWPAKVVEELQDLLQILDANGRIKHVSPSAERLTGYKPAELRGVFMQKLLHPDDVGVFTAELNESIASGTSLRVFYRLRKRDGTYAVFEAVGHGHIAAAKFAPNPENQTPFCQAVFMMARPYPTKNAALLDSFLEHKMENERLRRKIAELQREEQDEAEESERAWRQQSQETTPSDSGAVPPAPVPLQPISNTDTPVPLQQPFERRMSSDSGTAESASLASSTRRPSASASHTDTIEMLTGLRYLEGERSRGITTGNPSPALVTGDAGIAIPVERDQRAGEKKKKLKLAEEYVCTDCGNSQSQPSPMALTMLILLMSRNIGIAGMAQRAERAEDAVQCLRAKVGEEGEEEERPCRRRPSSARIRDCWLGCRTYVHWSGRWVAIRLKRIWDRQGHRGCRLPSNKSL